MHSLRSAAVQYTNYGTGGAFELPTQSDTYIYIRHCRQPMCLITHRLSGGTCCVLTEFLKAQYLKVH